MEKPGIKAQLRLKYLCDVQYIYWLDVRKFLVIEYWKIKVLASIVKYVASTCTWKWLLDYSRK